MIPEFKLIKLRFKVIFFAFEESKLLKLCDKVGFLPFAVFLGQCREQQKLHPLRILLEMSWKSFQGVCLKYYCE